MNIALDVDGVLIDLDKFVKDYIIQNFNKNPKVGNSWCMKEKYNITDEELSIVWEYVINNFYLLPPTNDANYLLKLIDHFNCNESSIFFISAIEEKYHNQRYENLLRNFSSIDFIKNEKFTLICTGEQSKHTSIIENDIDLYVDDRLKNIYDVKDLELKKYYLNCNHFEPNYDIMLNELKLTNNFHIIDNLKEIDLCDVMS